IPGTTRDAIEAVIDTRAVPLRLVDTAGLRESLDPVERIGVGVSESYVGRAAVVLACADSVSTLDALRNALNGRTSAPVIVVRTKADVLATPASELVANRDEMAAAIAVNVSAETGEGLDALLAAITSLVTQD